MFFIYLGEETGFAGWISSYAVMEGLDTKEGASKYPAIFWIIKTVTVFIFAGLPGKITTKLLNLIKMQTVFFFTSIIITILGFPLVGVYWNCFFIGIAYSSMYALIYSLPIEFNQIIT